MAVIELQDAPKKIRDLYNKGIAALERGNTDYAIDMFGSVVEMEPKLLQARKMLRATQVKKAKGSKGGMSGLKGMKASMNVKGQLKKDPEKALQAAEKLMLIDPLNKAFVQLFAQAAHAADMPEAAVLTLEFARDANPTDIDLLNQLGRMYQVTEQMKEARDCFEAIVRLDPADQKAIKNLKDAAALDTMHTGGWEGATDYRDVMADEDEAVKLEQQARAKKSESDVEVLIEETRQKIAREPENINFQRALADLLVTAGDYDEALEIYEKANELSGGSDPQIEKAINQTHVRIFDHNIEVLTEDGQTEEAEAMEAQKYQFLLEDAEDRTRRYPNDLQIKFEYGELLYQHDMLNEAIQQFQASQRNPQRRLESLYFMGLCFKEKGQVDIAAEQFEKAAAEIPTMDDTKMNIFYELGEIAEIQGNMEKAMGYYKDIYAVDIGYKDVAQKIDSGYSQS